MQELEKILEEIDQEVKEYMEIDFGDEYNAGIKDMAKMAKKIIRKHMNDGWIPVQERLPEEKKSVLVQWEKYDRHLNVTLTYLDVMWLDDAEEKVFETINGVPNGKVIAWRPLPDPYRPDSCKITFSEQEATCLKEREFCVCKDCEKTILKYIKSPGKRKGESIVSYIYRKMKEGSNGY